MRIEAYHFAGPADGSKPFLTPRRAYACRLLAAAIRFVKGVGGKPPVARLSVVDGEGNLVQCFAGVVTLPDGKTGIVNWHAGATALSQEIGAAAPTATDGAAETYVALPIPAELWVPAGSRVRLDILDQVGPGSAAAIDWQTIDLAFLVPIASDFGR